MKVEVFSPKFKKRLLADRFPVVEIEVGGVNGSINNAYTAVHQWLDKYYPSRFLRASLYNHQRDGVLPKITAGIDEILEPWKKANCTEFLPVITLKELSRIVGMHPRHIFGILEKWDPKFNIGEHNVNITLGAVSPLPNGKCERKKWQRQCAEQDTEYLAVKVVLMAEYASE
ncbi:hypothetical protein HY384_03775 [Candidatus Daviesbacteria bacterium]|nr:hypothetical protein [Candidatus Daviesbacteria bacterium]